MLIYRKIAELMVLVFILAGCSPMIYKPGAKIQTAQLVNNQFTTEDGIILPVKKWLPETTPKAVIIALHGFNDYSHFFSQPGEYFKQQGIASYAYDQRGFGETSNRGLWPGIHAFTDDLATFIRLIKRQYPGVPVYALGHSMGGSVVIVTMTQVIAPQVDGIILIAPAIWGKVTMPWYQTALLWTLSHTVPWLTLTGEGLDIMPSDNIEMLEAQSRDPLVIKGTRVEAIYGLVNLMDAALENAHKLENKTILLYGEKDEVIPKIPTYQFLMDLKKSNLANKTIAFYTNGYHMLLRDLQAEIAWKDIASWIASEHTSLPSGAVSRARQMLYQSQKTVN